MMYDVTDVKCLESYHLRLIFDNGEQREIDIRALIPFVGVFEKLHDETFFNQVRVEPDVGTIVWPNGADLCPDVLYEKSKPVNN